MANSTLLKIGALCFLVLLLSVNSSVAAESTDSSNLNKLRSIEKQLDEIEKAQKTSLETQDQIVADIKNLKIIVNKR